MSAIFGILTHSINFWHFDLLVQYIEDYDSVLKYHFWKNVTSEKWNSDTLNTFGHFLSSFLGVIAEYSFFPIFFRSNLFTFEPKVENIYMDVFITHFVPLISNYAPKILEAWNYQFKNSDICKLLRRFCNVWFFFCKNEVCVNCGKETAKTLTWLAIGGAEKGHSSLMYLLLLNCIINCL